MKALDLKIEDCGNYFTFEDIISTSHFTETEIAICSNCKNCQNTDDGIICRYKAELTSTSMKG